CTTMSANEYRSHIVVIPEDAANLALLNGFLLEPSLNQRNIEREIVAGGWTKVGQEFEGEHINDMRRYPKRYMVLLVDFDKAKNRLDVMQKSIPDDLKERVFVLGVWSNPEWTQSELKIKLEDIGKRLAEDCKNRTWEFWKDDSFKHNLEEIARMGDTIRAILFSS
ncbi:MAG: hypothetical protein NT023_13820, partial [Armatimonadetes bacterium]|nr:hypothetical protein [Armatimonadota bacterium]